MMKRNCTIKSLHVITDKLCLIECIKISNRFCYRVVKINTTTEQRGVNNCCTHCIYYKSILSTTNIMYVRIHFFQMDFRIIFAIESLKYFMRIFFSDLIFLYHYPCARFENSHKNLACTTNHNDVINIVLLWSLIKSIMLRYISHLINYHRYQSTLK